MAALLRSVLRPEDVEAVSGDLIEVYRDSIRPHRGRWEADLWYLQQVAGCRDNQSDEPPQLDIGRPDAEYRDTNLQRSHVSEPAFRSPQAGDSCGDYRRFPFLRVCGRLADARAKSRG